MSFADRGGCWKNPSLSVEVLYLEPAHMLANGNLESRFVNAVISVEACPDSGDGEGKARQHISLFHIF